MLSIKKCLLWVFLFSIELIESKERRLFSKEFKERRPFVLTVLLSYNTMSHHWWIMVGQKNLSYYKLNLLKYAFNVCSMYFKKKIILYSICMTLLFRITVKSCTHKVCKNN